MPCRRWSIGWWTFAERAPMTNASPSDRVPPLIERAVCSLIADDREAARDAIMAIDASALEGDRQRKLAIARVAPPIVDRVVSPRRRSISGRGKAAVFEADSYICRICDRKTIALPVLRRVSAAMPDLFPFHPNWAFGAGHIVYLTHSASLEHVIPLARGGADESSNFVTTCYGCNDARGDRTLEEMVWSLQPRRSASWRGLTEYLADLGPAPARVAPSRTRVARQVVNAEEIEVGAFVRLAMPGRKQLRKHRVEAILEDRRWSVRELWRSAGVWEPGRHLKVIDPPPTVELIAPTAPRDGDPCE